MLSDREAPAETGAESVASRETGGVRIMVLLAIALVVSAIGLRWIAETNTDLPSLKELVRESREFYLPMVRGEMPGETLGLNQAPGAQIWTATWLSWNGHWDARVLSVANLAVLVAGVMALWIILGRCVAGWWRVAVGIAVGTLVLLAPVSPRPDLGAGWSSGLVTLSLLHLVLMTSPRARPWSLGLGLAFGALNIAAATAGMASAVALVLWELLARRAASRPAHDLVFARWSLALNAVLVVAGVVLAVARAGPGVSGPGFFHSLQFLLAWPLECPGWALVVWAPVVICLIQWWRQLPSPATGHSPLSSAGMLALLGLWAIAQVVALAALQVASSDAAWVVLVTGLVVNAACFSVFPVTGWKGAARNQLIFGLWGIAMLNAVLNGLPASERVGPGPAIDEPLTTALQRAAFDGDTTALRASGAVSDDAGRELGRLLSDRSLRRVVPGSIRPPLAVERVTTTDANGFLPSGVPIIPGRNELPAWGTWSSVGGPTTGEFVSAPLESRAAFVQIRIAGELRPPATSLVLRLADGTEIAPMEGSFNAEARWKRVNFPAPAGRFQIVARDASAAAWLAFTAPQEVGRVTWLAGKIVRTWPWWLAAGLVTGGVAVAMQRRRATRDGRTMTWPPSPRVAWRMVPWLALTAYAVFFAHHVDGTAGPNDSGGYLNSAKLLAGGHVTGAPRMIFGPAAGETDITPYLPTTFFPTHDGRMAPEYPVGFPLEVAAVAKLTSLETAVPVVTILQLVLGVLFTCWLARAMGLPLGWAWLAAGIIGLSSVYLFQALQPQSDGPALVWVTAAIYWAWTSREKPWHAWLAGLATALAVMIRPSNLLCVAPLLVCFGGRWRQLASWALAGVPGALFQLWYNHVLYGNALTTGYGDISNGFALHFAPLTWKSYALWLPVMFTPVVVLAWFAPFLRAIPGRVRAVLTVWAAIFLTFYTFYWCTYDNWYNMRFVMPAAPAMVILGLWVLRWLTDRFGLALFSNETSGRTVLLSATLVVGLFALQVADTRSRNVVYWMQANQNYAVAATWARTHFPANAVVFAKPISGSIAYYTDFVVVRSDHPHSQSLEFFQKIARTGRPIFAVTSHYERKDFKWGAGRGDGYPDLPGTWERLASLCEGEILTWAWHPPNGAQK